MKSVVNGMGDMKFGACLTTFASCADRYCLSGYGGGAGTVKGMMDLAITVPDLSGIELVGNWHVNDENTAELKQFVSERGLQVCLIAPDLWTQAKWKKGSFCSTPNDSPHCSVGSLTLEPINWFDVSTTVAPPPANRLLTRI